MSMSEVRRKRLGAIRELLVCKGVNFSSCEKRLCKSKDQGDFCNKLCQNDSLKCDSFECPKSAVNKFVLTLIDVVLSAIYEGICSRTGNLGETLFKKEDVKDKFTLSYNQHFESVKEHPSSYLMIPINSFGIYWEDLEIKAGDSEDIIKDSIYYNEIKSEDRRDDNKIIEDIDFLQKNVGLMRDRLKNILIEELVKPLQKGYESEDPKFKDDDDFCTMFKVIFAVGTPDRSLGYKPKLGKRKYPAIICLSNIMREIILLLNDMEQSGVVRFVSAVRLYNVCERYFKMFQKYPNAEEDKTASIDKLENHTEEAKKNLEYIQFFALYKIVELYKSDQEILNSEKDNLWEHYRSFGKKYIEKSEIHDFRGTPCVDNIKASHFWEWKINVFEKRM